jgi:hypothetical protein
VVQVAEFVEQQVVQRFESPYPGPRSLQSWATASPGDPSRPSSC